ncbi:MAG: pentapeptide repeat-containing protein [Synechococcus sp.]
MRSFQTIRGIYIVSAVSGFVLMLVMLTVLGIDTATAREWLNILALPIVLALGTYLLVRQLNNRADRAKREHQSNTRLKSYLDRITALMMEKRLMDASFDDPVAQVARALTISTLRELDPPSQNTLIQFLLDAHLLQPPSRYAPSPALLKQVQWIHARLSGINLSEIDFSQAELAGAHLSGASLRHCNLRRANLEGANLQSADLSGADLRGADLAGAKLCGADLSGANLNLASLDGVDLSKANLSGTNLSVAKLSRSNLQHANLQGANLTSAKLMQSNLSEANLSGATLHWSNLESAVLDGANLSGTSIESANLCGANFSDTDCSEADLSRARYNAKTLYPQTFNPEKAGMINMDRGSRLFTYT